MKLVAFLLLACLQAAAQTDYVVFESGNFKGLKSSAGVEVLPPVYDDLGWSNGADIPTDQLIGYQDREKWGLISLEGKRITPPAYDKLEALLPGVFKVAVQGKFTNRYFYGLVNHKGKSLLSLDFFEIELRGQVVIVTTYENNQFREGAYSADLTRLLDPTYAKIEAAGSVLLARRPTGYLDVVHQSGTVLATGLQSAEVQRDMVVLRKAGKVGMISLTGSVIHTPTYKSISSSGKVEPFPTWAVQAPGTSFNLTCDSLVAIGQDVWLAHYNGFAQLHTTRRTLTDRAFRVVQRVGGLVVAKSAESDDFLGINEQGEVVLTHADSLYFDGHFFHAKHQKQWKVLDRSGKVLSEKMFDQVVPLNGQFLGVKKFGYWAIMDGIRASVSDFRYDSLAHTVGFRTIVKYVGRWGVHHPESGWLISPDFDQITFANDHFIAVKGRGSYLFNGDGQLLFQTIDYINPKPGYFQLRYDRSYSALGSTFRPIANTEYTSVSKWGDYFELKKADTTELYTGAGKRVLSVRDQVQDVAGYAEGFFLIKKHNRFGFVDLDGKLRIANRYDSAQIFSEGLAAVKIRGKWGFIDASERLVIQPHYQSVSRFSQGLAIFQHKGAFGLMDKSGREILAADFTDIERTTGGLFILRAADGRYGMADAKGILRLSASFQQITDLGENMLRVMQNDRFGLYDYSGKTIVPISYAQINQVGDIRYLKEVN